MKPTYCRSTGLVTKVTVPGSGEHGSIISDVTGSTPCNDIKTIDVLKIL